MKTPQPTRTLRAHLDLDQLRRQAKELLRAFLAGDSAAVTEINSHDSHADPASFALHDAQFVLARAYGFPSWPKLKAYVDGVTVKRFDQAAQSRDLAQVRAMLQLRPEIAHMGGAILYAVLNRDPIMVRILTEHGTSAHQGVYPHRDATAPLTIAIERGIQRDRGHHWRRRAAPS